MTFLLTVYTQNAQNAIVNFHGRRAGHKGEGTRISFGMENQAHTLTIATKITVTGVENVLTMTDKLVEVALADNVLSLSGVGFTPLHLSVEEGKLVLAGSVSSLRYAKQAGKESFFKRLMK